MQSTKMMMTLWVKWKKSVKSVLTLDARDFEYAKDIGNNSGDTTRR